MSHENNSEDEIVMERKNDVLLDFRNIIEKELSLIKIYDFVCNNPLDLIYQGNSVMTLSTKNTAPLFGLDGTSDSIDGGRLFIKEEYDQLKVEEKSMQIIQNSEEVAQKNGIKSGLRKRQFKYRYMILAIAFGLYFGLSTLKSFANYDGLLLVIAMISACAIPPYVEQKLKLKWKDFKEAHFEEVKEISSEYTKDIKIFIQDLINDARDRLIDNKIPLDKIQFILYSGDYQNVEFVRSQGGVRGTEVHSIYQFTYPEGMQPINLSSTQKSNQVYEDDNDSFILLKNASFSDDGKLVDFIAEYPSKENHELPEALLNSSKFETIKTPTLVIQDFDSNEKIVCECGELLKFSELKNCTSKLHNKFEFYLAIGEKCKVCKLNPFVLINSPGNEKIPDGLEKIFQ